MIEILLWLESIPIGVWVREAPTLLAFPTVLFLHTLGLAMLVGLNAALGLWILTARRAIRASAAVGLTRIMWAGFGVNAISGVLLLLAYPAKALTNPVFYAKLALIAAALVCYARLRARAFGATASTATLPRGALALAAAALLSWAGAILTGRLLAYTHSVLLAGEIAR